MANDVGLSYGEWKPPGKAKKPKPRQKSQEEQFQEAKSRCFRILADYLHLLRAWRKDYAPHSPEEAFHPRFVEALQKQDQVEYLLDVLLFGETEEKAALITDYGKDVIHLSSIFCLDKSVFIKPYSSLFFAISISIHSNICGNGSCFEWSISFAYSHPFVCFV